MRWRHACGDHLHAWAFWARARGIGAQHPRGDQWPPGVHPRRRAMQARHALRHCARALLLTLNVSPEGSGWGAGARG